MLFFGVRLMCFFRDSSIINLFIRSGQYQYKLVVSTTTVLLRCAVRQAMGKERGDSVFIYVLPRKRILLAQLMFLAMRCVVWSCHAELRLAG